MTRSKRKRAFGLVEVLVTLFVLAALAVPLYEMLSHSRRRGLSDDRLLTVHLEARAALAEAVVRLDHSGPGKFAEELESSTVPGDASDCALAFRPVEELSGLWELRSTVWFRVDDGRRESYALVRLWRDPAASAQPEIDTP